MAVGGSPLEKRRRAANGHNTQSGKPPLLAVFRTAVPVVTELEHPYRRPKGPKDQPVHHPEPSAERWRTSHSRMRNYRLQGPGKPGTEEPGLEATLTLGTAVATRRKAWLRSSGFSSDVQSTLLDLPRWR
ncbi:hypothetical protein NDU88_002911 [Pleurodeles waltl]|uniref:Uncharacterized protein n=1 Tax=Pleurodeles waltl TaxID=8319 RepID=A0AAV7M3V6_PLEWA|nr:hypothetical protein NDU88_002911 [Pleurodeles waltl]